MVRTPPARPRTAAIAVLAMLASASVTAAGPKGQDPIVGEWEQVDEDGQVGALVALRERGGVVEGVIVKVFPEPGEPGNPVCSRCQGPLKDAPVVGLTVIRDLKRTPEGYRGGQILDPDTGDTYQLEAKLSPTGQALEVRGFKGVSLFGRTQVWRRRT